MQWLVVSTLCQQTQKHLNPKVGFEGTPTLDPCWKLQLVACKVNMEWKLESKAKAKPHRREPAGSSRRTIPIVERIRTDVEPGEHSMSDCAVSKKLIHFFVMEVHCDNDGAIEFWRIKECFRRTLFGTILCDLNIGLMNSGRAAWYEEEETRKETRINSSGALLCFRALQGYSGRSLIDPPLQDNVIIPDGFFKCMYHVGCAINLHSIINSVLILGGQHLSNRQTAFFLLVDPMDKNHKHPDTINLEAPRLAQYMHAAWKKHQNTVYIGSTLILF